MEIPEIFKKKKILIVDDVSSIRMLARSMLLEVGFRYVAQAKNGLEALNLLRRKHFDLIICDWNMPVMDGLKLFKEIDADPELKNISFIMLTSSSESEKVKVAISLGITSYILKPFNPNTLVKHILEALQKTIDS